MIEETPLVGPCPDDETLGALVEGRLADTERARLERHVARCTTCLDVVAAAAPIVGAAAVGTTPASRMAEPQVMASIDRSGWRRVAIAAGLLVATAALALGGLATPLGARFVGPGIAALGSQLLGLPVDVATLALRPGAGGRVVLRLGRVSIGRGDGVIATADELAVTVALAASLSGESPVERVEVTGASVDLAAYGPAALEASRTGRARILAAFAADRIDVVGSRAVVPGPQGGTLVISDITGGAERDGDGVRLAFHGRTANGTLDLTGRVTPDADELRLTIGGRGLQADTLPLFGEGLRGTMDLRLDVLSEGDAVRADGRVAVRDGAVVGRGPAALLGLAAEARGALAAFDAGLAADDLLFDEARAVVAWRQGTWRLPRVFVSGREIVAGGRARIDADAVVRGHGTVRLPDDLVAALAPQMPAIARFRDASGSATLPFGVAGPLASPTVTLGRR
jgi:hypothetical protein